MAVTELLAFGIFRAKRVFFSFHYQDVSDFRANVVRNHWLTKTDRAAAGFFDASIWETARKTSPIALKRLINSEIENTTVTCVLIGSETWMRPWVRYEILKSFKRGNHIIGVHINSIRDKSQIVKPLGLNPLDFLGVKISDDGAYATLFEHKNSQWVQYTEIDGSSTYRRPRTFEYVHRGKFYKLSEIYPTYDWVRNDGYSNFSTWIG